MLIGPGAVQDGLGIVLVRSFFRLAVWLRFLVAFGAFWGCTWGRFGPFGRLLGVVLAFLDAF